MEGGGKIQKYGLGDEKRPKKRKKMAKGGRGLTWRVRTLNGLLNGYARRRGCPLSVFKEGEEVLLIHNGPIHLSS